MDAMPMVETDHRLAVTAHLLGPEHLGLFHELGLTRLAPQFCQAHNLGHASQVLALLSRHVVPESHPLKRLAVRAERW
jgi:hypothetical protein